MIDPMVSLAHTVFTNKGVHALLLGSGMSRAAEIPTGWDITLDLIRRLAAAEGDDPGDDPEAWYAHAKGKVPDYSEILDALARTPDERRAILHRYIDPTADDIEEGRRVPTRAHHAIAALSARGYVRMILTTNFDRLLENALREAGVEPIVIASADDVKGAAPLPHCRCIVVKLHGDYLDTRIKNTEAELATYDPALDAYLDRVLDEFGLIVCGWSGAWDTALRSAIARCPNRRYTTFWATRGEPHALAQDLIAKRAAQVIRIKDADDFFDGLAERIAALEEIDRPHPLTAQTAVAMLKRYLAEDRYRIRLHDLVMGEVSAASGRLRSDEFRLQGGGSDDEFRRRVRAYEAATEVLRKLVATGAYWSRPETDRLWTDVLRCVALTRREGDGLIVWIALQAYPATLAFYAAGLGALTAGNFRLLNELLSCPVGAAHRREIAVACLLPVALGVDRATWRCLPDLSRRHTPLNDHLLDLLRPELAALLPGAAEFEDVFDRFEALAALVYLDHASGGEDPDPERCWLPAGRFAWRMRRSGDSLTAWFGEAEREQENWLPLRGGMFGGSYRRLAALKTGFDGFVRRVGREFW